MNHYERLKGKQKKAWKKKTPKGKIPLLFGKVVTLHKDIQQVELRKMNQNLYMSYIPIHPNLSKKVWVTNQRSAYH